MKKCPKCNRNLDETNFWIRKYKKSIGIQSVCKECSSKRRTEYHTEHKKEERKVRLERKRKNREWLIEYKKTLKCTKCKDDRYYVLEFHHTSPKRENISNMLSYSINTIKEELRKCICLCANCHKEIHFKGIIV